MLFTLIRQQTAGIGTLAAGIACALLLGACNCPALGG